MSIRSRMLLHGLALGVVSVVALGPTSVGTATPTRSLSHSLQFFGSTSWWTSPVSADAPNHPDEERILHYLRTAPENRGGFLRLAGAGDNQWGQPVYWAQPGDKEYDVRWSGARRPAELDTLRIPAGMQAAETSDKALTLFDVHRGYVVAMTGADYNSSADRWSVEGATVTYLESNGLHARTGESDDSRNQGSHRGNNGATMMARYDLVQAGEINHVIKLACGPECSVDHVFPMIGSDGDSQSSPVKQGLRMRIRTDVDLDALGLHPEALVIARAAQKYGVYFGDSGGNTALKLENTRAQGRGQLWTVDATALSSLPFTTEHWDVLPEGYDPSR